MIPQEQITQIKKQLFSQIEQTNLPNKEEIKNSINQMSPEQLEEFLVQNKIKISDSPQTQQCIFCSIVSEQTQSYKIDENKGSIAILEINPISKAHILIIPKQHISSSEKIPKTAFTLAKKIAKKIKTKFKPKDVLISSANLFGHEIINILPVYENETLESQRNQEKPEELEKLKKQLEKKIRIKVIKKSKPKKIKEKFWLPRRIP